MRRAAHPLAGEAVTRLVAEQLAARLERIAKETGGAPNLRDPDVVHDIRVSVRRTIEALRVFAAMLPEAAVNEILGELRRLMRATAELRNRDIALELAAKAEVPPATAWCVQLSVERNARERDLAAVIEEWNAAAITVRWREQLGLDAWRK